MGREEILEALRERELDVDHAGIREDHNEGRELSNRRADLDGSAVGPVHLSLLARERFDAQEGFLHRRTQGRQVIAQHRDAALVADAPELVEEAGRLDLGELGQTAAEVILEGVNLGRLRRGG